jgi:putative sugar O-methyltransferase
MITAFRENKYFLALLRKFSKSFFFRYITKHRLSTSISDDYVFTNFCKKAASNTETFKNFRSNEIFRTILEHTSPELGDEYLRVILDNSHDYKFISKFVVNDDVGMPEKHLYGKFGFISPSTLRYVKVLSDLKLKFGDLNGKKIVEIGGGYGGQARVLFLEFMNLDYTIIDLPEVLLLINKFTESANLNSGKLNLFSALDFPTIKSDLVISNYAFSELIREHQIEYLNKIINNSDRGYITYNNINPLEFQSLTIEEFSKFKSNCLIESEMPESWPGNKIVSWR